MKTKTVYIPLKEGEIITSDYVYFSDQSNIPESTVAFSGIHYMPDVHCPFFRPIEVPAELVEPKEDPCP